MKSNTLAVRGDVRSGCVPASDSLRVTTLSVIAAFVAWRKLHHGPICTTRNYRDQRVGRGVGGFDGWVSYAAWQALSYEHWRTNCADCSNTTCLLSSVLHWHQWSIAICTRRMCVCVCACVRACVRVCVCVQVHSLHTPLHPLWLGTVDV